MSTRPSGSPRRGPAGRDGAARTAAATRPSTTPMLAFQARQPFAFNQHNCRPEAGQTGRAGERYLTSSDEFLRNVLLRKPQDFRIVEEKAQLPCLPPEAWRDTAWRGRRVLFLLPSGALGDNVGTVLFLKAFAEQSGARAIGVFGARSTADIYIGAGVGTVYTLWIGRGELKRWDLIVDFGHLPGRSSIDVWPVDMETQLLEAFGMQPTPLYPSGPRPVPAAGPLRIGVLPLASSPLRTLPPSACLALLRRLLPEGEVTLCLNANQRQGRLYREAVAPLLPPGVRLVEVFPRTGDLVDAVAGFDYAVFADSGPAHLSKLFATPGVAVYSSAPGEVLQGRFTNLARWTVPFVGPWCASPCGLAKLRRHRDGRVGCMGSLQAKLEDLPGLPGGADARVVDRLFEEPVPCIAHLRDHPEPLAEFVAADLAARRAAARDAASGDAARGDAASPDTGGTADQAGR